MSMLEPDNEAVVARSSNTPSSKVSLLSSSCSKLNSPEPDIKMPLFVILGKRVSSPTTIPGPSLKNPPSSVLTSKVLVSIIKSVDLISSKLPVRVILLLSSNSKLNSPEPDKNIPGLLKLGGLIPSVFPKAIVPPASVFISSVGVSIDAVVAPIEKLVPTLLMKFLES